MSSPRGKPTITDVARAADVSKSTVSFVLNNRPGVAQETRERVLAVATSLGWSPDRSARSLSNSRAYAVGMVVARPPELLGSDPFFPAFIAGVEKVLSGLGQALVLQVVPDDIAEHAGYHTLASERRVDGVFVSDLRPADTRIALLEEVGVPAVTLGQPDVASGFPAVTVDEQMGIAEAVRHLVALGHTRIAHVAGPADFLHGTLRRAAWERAVTEAGLTPGECLTADFTAAGGAAATRRLLAASPPPTAIVYANDIMAIAGLAVAQELGLSVPGDLSVTGYDDIEIAAHLAPPLTTVRTDVLGWGEAAARTLLALIDAGGPSGSRTHAGTPVESVDLPPAQLIVRSSTAAPATDRQGDQR